MITASVEQFTQAIEICVWSSVVSGFILGVAVCLLVYVWRAA